jgi:hypothetical protein
VNEDTTPQQASEEEEEHVEIARAHDRLEAIVWQKLLENKGYSVKMERRGGLIHAILYLGRIPQAIMVPEKDAVEARQFLKDSRLIR